MRFRTRRSVLTPTVSRKLTGLRSRMIALGRDRLGCGSTSMTEMFLCSSICTAPSCAGGQIAQMQSKESCRKVHIEKHNKRKNLVYYAKGM